MRTFEELVKSNNLIIHRTAEDGGCGEIWRAGKPFASVVWSNGGGWEHVSMAPYDCRHTPTWSEMCSLKEMFFRDDEVAVQYHPAKSEYVNNMPNCLHLWRPLKEIMPTPPSIMVGVKKGQTFNEVREDIESVLREDTR